MRGREGEEGRTYCYRIYSVTWWIPEYENINKVGPVTFFGLLDLLIRTMTPAI